MYWSRYIGIWPLRKARALAFARYSSIVLISPRGYLVESSPGLEKWEVMKAAVMKAAGEPLAVEDVEIAGPGPFEVLIRVAAAGLCHSDLTFLEGSYPHATPAVLGHESAGVVEAVGEGVTHVATGDHVITSISAFCGMCSYCSSDQPHLCDNYEATRRKKGDKPRLSRAGDVVHQFLNLSSFAEQMLVHENTVVKIGPNIPLQRAALLGCGVATGLGAVLNTAGVSPGESVAVIGCGGVGLSAVQGARIAGAAPIIAVDVVTEKLALAESLGATHVVNAADEDPVARVREFTGGLGAHHAIEAIGTTSTAEQAFAMIRRGGTATIVGLIPGQNLTIPTDALFQERRIQGSVMGSNRFRVDTPRYVEMFLDGRLNLDDMVTRHLSLEEINDGFADMRSGRSVRSLIVFD